MTKIVGIKFTQKHFKMLNSVRNSLSIRTTIINKFKAIDFGKLNTVGGVNDTCGCEAVGDE
jgi:hypothetical protein